MNQREKRDAAPLADPPPAETSRGRIYIDLDDVLCETARKLMVLAEREFGRNVLFENISSFNIAVAFNLSAPQVEHTMQLMHEPEMLLSLDPLPDARPVLEQWIEAGFLVDIVTGRPPSTEEVSRAWLRRHGIPHRELVFVNKYDRDDPHPSGVPYLTLPELQARTYCLAIDDSPEMALFLAQNMNTDVVLFDRPWNAGVPVPASRLNRRIERCRSWAEITRAFSPGSLVSTGCRGAVRQGAS